MHLVDLEQFWHDDAIANADPFGAHIPQPAMGIHMGYFAMWAELGLESDMARLDRDFDFARQCAHAYNEKAQVIVGKPLLNENAYDPSRRFPRLTEIGELFGCKRIWQSESWWLTEAAHTPAELSALLDRVDRLDVASHIYPDNWDAECARVFQQHGLRPSQPRSLRGPVTLATSIYGVENLIYLITDEPAMAARFRDMLKRVILDYFKTCREHTPPHLRHPGFGFLDDNCAMLTPEMYDFFGRPIVQAVFDEFAPAPRDRRYQHSDSDMGHLLPLLASTGLNRVNFGPNVRFADIRAAMPHAVVEGTLAPFTFMRNDETQITSEVCRDLDEARNTRGLVVATAGSVNDGSRLSSMRLVMSLIQRHGRYSKDNHHARHHGQ